MKYFCVDVETTGTDRERLQLLELAVMFVDTDKLFPATIEEAGGRGLIRSWVVAHESLRFKVPEDLPALMMNTRVFELLSKQRVPDPWQGIYKLNVLTDLFVNFVKDHVNANVINVCGKNVASFDWPIITRDLRLEEYGIRARHRFIDPANMYVDFGQDSCLPDLPTIVKRLPAAMELRGISGIAVYDRCHEAAYDVWNTALAVWTVAQRVKN